MLKLLRQYNQWILVVGGTLLLVAFLMPSAITSCAERGGVASSTWATYAKGGSITGAEYAQTQQELRVVERMQSPMLTGLGADRDASHWWLLVHEAEEAGLLGGAGDGDAVLAQIALSSNMLPEQVLARFAQELGTNPEVVLTALGKMQAVNRLVSLASSLDRVSDRRLANAIAQSLLGVSGDLAVIDARKDTSIPIATLTDAQLNEHLTKFADKVAPTGTTPVAGAPAFGYRIPDRFKLEWIAISKAAIAASMQNSPELSSLALRKRFARDPAKYGANPAENPTFAAFEAAVRTKATDELVAQRVEEIAKFTTDQLALAQRSLARKGAYFDLPADWTTRMPAFTTLAQSVATEFGIELPAYASSGEEWITVSDVEAIPGLGRASTAKYGAAVRAPQLALGANELSAASIAAPFQVNIASPSLTSDNGDVYFFRMIAAEPSRPARDLAEVRPAVEKDVLALERFKWLQTNLGAIEEQAAAGGVRVVADRFAVPVEFARDLREANPQFISYGIRIGSTVPGLSGTDAKVLHQIVEKASRLPLTTDLSTLPLKDRTVAVASEDLLTVVVMQITELAPVTSETFATLAASNPRIVDVARDPTMLVDPKLLFSLEALKTRHEFQNVRDTSETADGNDSTKTAESKL